MANKSFVWIPDSHRSNCLTCRASFSLIRRRHHCRLCGEVFCDQCSNERIHFSRVNEPVRACGKCAKWHEIKQRRLSTSTNFSAMHQQAAPNARTPISNASVGSEDLTPSSAASSLSDSQSTPTTAVPSSPSSTPVSTKSGVQRSHLTPKPKPMAPLSRSRRISRTLFVLACLVVIWLLVCRVLPRFDVICADWMCSRRFII